MVGLTPLFAPFKGGVFVPDPDFLFVGLPLDGLGGLEISFTWPAGAPVGMSTYYQLWNQDPGGPVGFSASNALLGVVP